MKMAWYFVQTLMGCIGSVGFAVLFNIRGRKLLLAAGGGALAWAVYLACTCNGLDIFAGLFFATLAAALASELLARAVKAPVIMLLVPMLIPLIPGGDLYYMMSFLVRGQYEAFGQYAQRVLTEAGAIALGIICKETVVPLPSAFWLTLMLSPAMTLLAFTVLVMPLATACS